MLAVSISNTVERELTALTSVQVGLIPSGRGTPDRYVTVSRDGDPFLRVDIYADSGSSAFEEAIVWRENVVVGFGYDVHLIGLSDHAHRSIPLEWYFGHLYPSERNLFVTSAQRVFCIGPDQRVLWRSEIVGIDGVVLDEIDGPIVRGRGEWDPPGGWRPFALLASSGAPD
jgi:hypothetical protein